LLYRIFQDRVANLFCGLIFVVTHDLLDLKTALLIAAVVSAVRIKEKNISSVHQRQLFYVRGVHLLFPERHRKIFVPVRMVLGKKAADGHCSIAVYLLDGNRPRFLGTVGVPDRYPLPRVEQTVEVRYNAAFRIMPS
jgi:hypothetical protein